MAAPSGIPRHYAALSVAGRVRDHNEDAVLCCPQARLWAVADGMGGKQRGEVASELALEALLAAVSNGQGLRRAVHIANLAVYEAGRERGVDMGTTLVAIRMGSRRDYELAWVGDSRAYCVGPAQIRQLSQDHSWVQTMIDAGQLTPEAARRDPRRNIVLRCLGQTVEGFDIGYAKGELRTGESLLLCSDGLSGELDDSEILHVCQSGETPAAMVRELIDKAEAAGGRDNISCIVLGPNITTTSNLETAMRALLRRLIPSPSKTDERP